MSSSYNRHLQCPSVVLICLILISIFVSYSHADTPANCTYGDIEGAWVFSVGSNNNDRTLNCSTSTNLNVVRSLKIKLQYPDVAIDEFGNQGFWTIIYNQGFEVAVAGRKYFAFSKYVGEKSFCHETMPGWTHNLLGRDWACFSGKKNGPSIIKYHQKLIHDNTLHFSHRINSAELVSSLNSKQTSWQAVRYPQFDGLTQQDYVNMAGGPASAVHGRPTTVPVTDEHRLMISKLPANFDWRNVDGVNYVSPVRNQGGCGSCYAFASLAMIEARVRILTNNTQKPVFAPQDIVECSEYSEGCSGGFPYLIGGKYSEDFGLVTEDCNKYSGKDGTCHTNRSCPRQYSTGYRYVGGYYGGCNEPLMMEALYNRGPIAVGFQVYKDFTSYKSGVYHHTFTDTEEFNPFELTNHAVLMVGWGTVESTGEKYWIVKNSWGESWGQDGYFWIKRGNDECGIESLAAESDPVLTW